MMHIKRWVSVVSVGIVTSACSSIEVDRVAPGAPVAATGVLYALPTTVLRAQIKINRVEKSGAPYARFAAIFAPDDKPVCPEKECTAEEKIVFSAADGATLSSYGEPDVSQIFLVKFSGGGAIDQSLSMTWNEAGLLSSTSSTVTNRTIDLVSSGFKMVTSIGAKFAAGAAGAVKKHPVCAQGSAADTWAIPILQDAGIAAPQLIESYCNIKSSTRSAFANTSENEELLASAVKVYVRAVLPLANARSSILDGTSNSVDQTNLLSKLDTELDTVMKRYFIGKSDTKTWTGVFDTRQVTSDSSLPLSIPLLKLNSKKGVCVQAGASFPPDAKPLPKDFEASSAVCDNAVKSIGLTVAYYPSPSSQLFTKIKDDATGTRSFRYRIPAQVSATLGDGSQEGTLGAAVLSVAQLGTVISFPAQRHSKSLTYELGFVEATGALKSFKLGTTGGFDSSTVDALSGAAGTAIDARNAAHKSEQDLAVLSQQDQLLKLRDDICTIQKKYGISCTVAP